MKAKFSALTKWHVKPTNIHVHTLLRLLQEERHKSFIHLINSNVRKVIHSREKGNYIFKVIVLSFCAQLTIFSIELMFTCDFLSEKRGNLK